MELIVIAALILATSVGAYKLTPKK